MIKHYTFQHSCGHTAIGPLIRTSTTPSIAQEVSPPPFLSTSALQSIHISLPIHCPFCEEAHSYQNVASGDGLLAILELSQPTSSQIPSTPHTAPDPIPIEWRILRVCHPDEISTSDWYLAHGPDGHCRQMAWIPRPCGGLSIGGVEGRRRNGEVLMGRRVVDCSWRQEWRIGDGVRTRLPGMFSALNASLVDEALEENMARLGL